MNLSLLLQNKRLLLLFGFAILLIITLFVFLFLSSTGQETTPQSSVTPTPVVTDLNGPTTIVSVSPKDKQIQADYTGMLTVTFSKNVSVHDVSITISPQVSGQMKQITGTQVAFDPSNDLQMTTEYQATLTTSNDKLVFTLPSRQNDSRYGWTFITDTPTGEEVFTEADKENFRKIREAADKAYEERKQKIPFLTSLPHYATQYRIEITDSDVIVITTYGSTQEDITASREDALKWIEDHGGDPTKLVVEYNTEPLP